MAIYPDRNRKLCRISHQNNSRKDMSRPRRVQRRSQVHIRHNWQELQANRRDRPLLPRPPGRPDCRTQELLLHGRMGFLSHSPRYRSTVSQFQ